MTMTITSTVGGVSSNSYVTLAEAVSYFEARLHKDAWANASTTEKTAALLWATKVLASNVSWLGVRATTVQALDWPRYGVPEPNSAADSTDYCIPDTVIPSPIKSAQYEMALALLNEDRTLDPDSAGMANIRVGPISVGYQPGGSGKMPVIPRIVRDLLLPYADTIIGGSSIPLRRT